MDYRAQFSYKTPAGFCDEPYEYYFDFTQVVALLTDLAVGQIIQVNFPVDVGPEFLCRGITISVNSVAATLGVQFIDAIGNYLSSDFEPVAFFAGLNLDAATNGGLMGDILEPEVYFPSGSIIGMRIQRLN